MNIEAILSSLAKKRPIFHSEADFQHALGREIHLLNPGSEVRLEVPSKFLNRRASIDLIVRLGEKSHYFELKYKTAFATVQHENETFSLKLQGAKDHGSYDFLKDISRVETFVRGTPGSTGWVIMLTNVASYWKGSAKPNPIDKDFHLLEGRELSGKLAWQPHAGSGSITKREQPIELRGRYVISWKPYSEVAGEGCGSFRYLCFPVGSHAMAESEISPASAATNKISIKEPDAILQAVRPEASGTGAHKLEGLHPSHHAPKMESSVTAGIPETQRHAVLESLKALGGQASIKEVKRYAKEHWGMDIKHCGTVMPDMVSPKYGGNQTSTVPAELRRLAGVSRGVYRLIGV